MCQLNIYCVPKSLEKVKVLKLMDEVLGYSFAECIDEENPIPTLKDEYSFYIVGGMRCNCSSVLCQFQEADHSLTYGEHWQQIAEKERARLLEMKAIMESPDYPEKKKNFIAERERLFKVYSKLFEDMRKYEEENMAKIMDDENLSDEQKNEKMREVYAEVEKLAQKVEETEDAKRYNTFIKENSLMNATIELTLKKEKVLGKARMEKSKKVLDEIEVVFSIEGMLEMVGDDKKQKNGEKEYEQTKEFIDKILEEVPEMKILCYWQDGNEITIDSEKNINIKEISIETLAHLKYLELLTITK